MDAVVIGALEEICFEGIKGLFHSQRVHGLTLHDLWPKIHSHLSSNNLPLCNNVKKAFWSNLLVIPSLRFECNGVSYGSEDPQIQSFEDSERMELKILAAEHLLNSFVGIHDHTDISEKYRHVLERIAIARTDGVTQNDLAKELGIQANNIHHILKNLESRCLIVRQSTIIRNIEVGNEGREYKNGSIVNTNMLYLYRYAKHLGRLQRLEITKEDTAFITDNDNVDGEVGTREEHIKDFEPDLRAICDMLEKVNDKVLVVSDIKKELGYGKRHKAWRNILHRLKDAGLVEEFYATVNKKKVSCLRLLKKFSANSFAPKSYGGGDDDLDTEQQVKPAKRGQITEQIVELPIKQQIYDMIDAKGSKGLLLNEVYKRLGIDRKQYSLIRDMVSRSRIQLDSERLNRNIVYRAWTSGNFNTQDSDHLISKQNLNSVASGSADHASPAFGCNDTLFDSRTSYNLQCDANGLISEAELQMENVKPAEKAVSLEISSSASPAARSGCSYTVHPRLGLNSVSLQREQRIIEILQEEKILLKPELRRRLESLKNHEKIRTLMDKKTLDRSLNKLQKQVVAVLHPSVVDAEDLSDRVHERFKSFERQIRAQDVSGHKNGSLKRLERFPVLNGVERIGTNVTKDVPTETHEAKRNNGFISAKMVRAKLLHIFLWGYINAYEPKNPHGAYKLFELDAAIKAMPLELFLQVAGSSPKSECMIEKFRNDLRLSELPIHIYKCLMDSRAAAHLAALIDILKRFKLIRLIGGELVDVPHVILRHSLELKSYIEEPARMILPSTDVDSFDLRPHLRHDFVFESIEVVHEYWNTLEYCYAASERKAALLVFPGSAVKEVLFSRSWESARVMTADQQAKLFKLVANEDTDKKISYKKCKEIAKKLNLTLEQVLRYDQRQKHKSKGAQSGKEQEYHPLIQAQPSYKRKRSLKGKPVNNGMENVDEELGKLKRAKTFIAEERTRVLEADEMHILIDELDGQKDENAGEDGHSHSTIHKYARRKRFAWTENKDRQLVTEYVRNRAALGAKFHHTDWASLRNLPASPRICKRRMSTLMSNDQFRNAINRICNMLGLRYAKHLENSNNKPFGGHTNDLNLEERWDDFDNKDIKIVLDELLCYKQTAKPEANKGYGMLMNGEKCFRAQTYISLAVANAMELLKIVYLSTAKARDLLVETLCQYSENDMLTAFNYLRERNFLVTGNGINDFVLSRKFSHNISSSPFPPNTGERADEMGKWLNERENDLLDKSVDLYAAVQCGDVLQLCLLMCVGELSMFPCVPHEGVGEIEDSKKRNRDDNDFDKAKKPKLLDNETFSRKEKGFPGIKLSLRRSMISRVDAVTLFSGPSSGSGPGSGSGSGCGCGSGSGCGFGCGSNLEQKSSSGMTLNGKSIWEDMACYAKHLTSSEVSPFLFQTIYSAIQKAGDQGLSMEGISNVIDDVQQGEKIAEFIVEVLEAFGRALKVNGYDCVHVVDSKYRSKYRLLAASHQQDLDRKNRMDAACYKPILPWVDVDGTINENVYKGLVRRLLGIVMQNPGILEEHVIGHMNELNPQSCRKLLEAMIVDGHIRVRKMYESISKGPPTILLGFKKPKMVMVCKQHLFANPTSITFL